MQPRQALTKVAVAAIAFACFADTAAFELLTPPADPPCCAILELRQYTLKPGQRDVLIELFDHEFVETQEATGMRIVGQFRDGHDPDRFVWLRGFDDMDLRRRALTAFYDGPVWKTHGRQAAATMIDSDDVLLLRPVGLPRGFYRLPATRPPLGATQSPNSIVAATIYRLQPHATRGFPDFYRESIRPALRGAGVVVLAALETEPAPNNYPRLPVREGERSFVWLAYFEGSAAHAAAIERLAHSPQWAEVESALPGYLKSPPEHLRLQPTARSLLR